MYIQLSDHMGAITTMPYPSQINAEVILQTACDIISQAGVENLSMNKLAQAMNVKAPSLYRYYNSKSELLRAINQDTITRLVSAVQPTPSTPGKTTPIDQSLQIAQLYREFAHENAAVYGMLFTNTIENLQPEKNVNALLLPTHQNLMAALYGEQNAIKALRGFLALIHGYAMLNIAQHGQQKKDWSSDYETSVRAYLEGWQPS